MMFDFREETLERCPPEALRLTEQLNKILWQLDDSEARRRPEKPVAAAAPSSVNLGSPAVLGRESQTVDVPLEEVLAQYNTRYSDSINADLTCPKQLMIEQAASIKAYLLSRIRWLTITPSNLSILLPAGTDTTMPNLESLKIVASARSNKVEELLDIGTLTSEMLSALDVRTAQAESLLIMGQRIFQEMPQLSCQTIRR
ncbi:hypothetical protein M422DRAFT_261195 [Sphaerobolus stellatus SS14]|uniref:Uncharacterized protein n=1 Tax=Sphaerobolus stellatus (strain SS14) TaxID=990650 RepID=A0A0C9VGJ0_SPHS4|nr:hypothetical protein M422DRAFT_261195 [Sphaerobolus stellatus SS14]